jgi:p38 MAP kinase
VLISGVGLKTLRFVQSLPKRQRVPFNEKLRCNDESALDLLEKMLVFDPRKRINATECLSHEYVSPYHDPTDEPVAAEKFDWSFNDADLPVDSWKVMMYAEILGTLPSLSVGLCSLYRSVILKNSMK